MRAFALFVAVLGAVATALVPVASPVAAAPVMAATTSASDGSGITFATYNICKIECRSGKYSWPNRRLAMARNVAAADPDVLAVQEADKGSDHWRDVADLLDQSGYTIANDNLNCTAACGAHLFYKRSVVELVPGQEDSDPAGLVSLQSLTPGAPWRGIKQDRYFAWAFFREKSGGATFVAISLHLPNEKTPSGEQVRVAAARGVAQWSNRRAQAAGLDGRPIIVMGDLNSYAPRQPNGAQKQFADAGYRDSFTAQRKINEDYSTVNVTSATARYGGWPPSPPRFGPLGNRLDYILAKNTARASVWEIFLKLRNGRFDDRYRASDHNLVRATIPIR